MICVCWAPRRSPWKLTERIDSSKARWGFWRTRYSERSTNPWTVFETIRGALRSQLVMRRYSAARWACRPHGAFKSWRLTHRACASTSISLATSAVCLVRTAMHQLKPCMTALHVSGGTWTSSSSRPGCALRCPALPVAPVARPVRSIFPGRAKAVVLRHCLKPWPCRCARSCRCAGHQRRCGARTNNCGGTLSNM